MSVRKPSKTEAALFARALQAASVSTVRCRHGALVARGRSVLAVGVNVAFQCRKLEGWSRHAEIAALVACERVCGSLRGLTLVSARMGGDGLAAISKPCGACQRAIESAGIERVIYHDGAAIVVDKIA